MPEPDWKRYGYSSLESYVESMAGASPPDVTERYRAALEEIVSRHPRESWPEHPACLIAAAALGDSPPDAVVEDARLLVDEVEAAESFLRAGPDNPYGKRDFPMPVPPPYEADDENEATPDE